MIATIFEAIVKSDRNGRGAAGETFAKSLLEQSGYMVEKCKKRRCGDLRAIDAETGEFWNVEVKTAKRRSDNKFCFQLLNHSQDYRHADYVLLVAVIPGGKVASFLIPVDVLKKRGAKSITIVNLNSGMWSHYRVKRTVRL